MLVRTHCVTIFFFQERSMACWHISLQLKNLNHNDWSVRNQIKYTALKQSFISYLSSQGPALICLTHQDTRPSWTLTTPVRTIRDILTSLSHRRLTCRRLDANSQPSYHEFCMYMRQVHPWFIGKMHTHGVHLYNTKKYSNHQEK